MTICQGFLHLVPSRRKKTMSGRVFNRWILPLSSLCFRVFSAFFCGRTSYTTHYDVSLACPSFDGRLPNRDEGIALFGPPEVMEVPQRAGDVYIGNPAAYEHGLQYDSASWDWREGVWGSTEVVQVSQIHAHGVKVWTVCEPFWQFGLTCCYLVANILSCHSSGGSNRCIAIATAPQRGEDNPKKFRTLAVCIEVAKNCHKDKTEKTFMYICIYIYIHISYIIIF